MAVKVAFIGAGSVGFTRKLMRDILCVPELADTEFSLHDVDKRNLQRVAELCRRDIRANKLPAKVRTSVDRRRALAGADYVFNVVRIGGVEAFRKDIEIPLKYGIDQCVGDTLAPGGIFYAQRNIPQLLAFCEDIRAVAADDCLLMNYANPMAMNTWAAIKYGRVRTVGLCHGIEHGWMQIADVLGAEDWRDVEIVCAGINHQTWYTKIIYRGREVGPDELLEAFERHPTYSHTEKVRIDVLRRFGYYSTESNGHLSEYLPWYRKRPKEIRRWIDTSHWINGETGGYLREVTENRRKFDADFERMLSDEPAKIAPECRGHERGSHIVEALETGRCWRGHLNVRNDGCITNLPDDCIVEVPAYLDATGINIPRVGDLPAACAATCSVSVNVQRMAMEAAVAGDVTLLKQALLHDPLTAAVCDPVEVWQLADEMLIAEAKWLPQYASEIPAAKKRLAAAKRKGEYRGTWKWNGAARKRPRKQ